jgi:RNA recognition motif-containing protein
MMTTKLHVGNLPPTSTQRDLQDLFSIHGNVVDVTLPVERESRRTRGFAIVTMATPSGAQAAILALNGKELQARVLTVDAHAMQHKDLERVGDQRHLAC